MSLALAIDGMNFLHRARAGMKFGPAPVVFNFMRNFRALVDQFSPNEIYFILEGKPQHRLDISGEYKANRKIDPESEEYKERQKFFSQVDEILAVLRESFPVNVVRHPRFECDDTIFNLVKNGTGKNWIVVSNDSDFTQLLNGLNHVKIWNPMKKGWVAGTAYDYVTWKSLRGDGADNISGLPGIGDKTAEELALNPEMLQSFLRKDSVLNEQFEKNLSLIRFSTWFEQDWSELQTSSGSGSWDPLKNLFTKYSFASLLKDDAWCKFIGTFDKIRSGHEGAQ